MARSGNPKEFLSSDESSQIDQTIAAAERNTSAEIKIVIARHCWDDLRKKAIRHFEKLNLDKTQDRNCVLVMLVVANREFVIYGDRGIHEQVGVDFWQEVRDKMITDFSADEFGQGLCEAIAMIGEKLKTYFPYKTSDRDEISNEIEYED